MSFTRLLFQKPVFLSLYTSGRDAKSFPQPEKFWPERWLRETSCVNKTTSGSYRAVANPYASMPFAIGARSCVGRKLAETQMIATLASVSFCLLHECCLHGSNFNYFCFHRYLNSLKLNF